MNTTDRLVAALDLSLAKTAVAWGTAGQKPEGTTLIKGLDPDRYDETARLVFMVSEILHEVAMRKAGFVIFSEFYHSVTMLAFRANAGLRGAVLYALKEKLDVEALPVAEISARKEAGLDLSKRKDSEPRHGYMKGRAKQFLETQGLGHLSEDEGDAAILLMGANAVITIGETQP